LLATGGSRGAFIAAGGDGRLYIASTTGVDVLFPANRRRSSPATQAMVRRAEPDSSHHGHVRLDDVRGTPADSRSVLNPANYRITDMATGQGVSVGAVVYDASARRAELVFEPLAPSSYELQVLSAVQDDLGNALGTAYSADLRSCRIAQPRSAAAWNLPTRGSIAAGTVSFDVRVKNTTNEVLAGPVRVNFLSIAAQGLAFVAANGGSAPASIDLVPPAGTLAVGATRIGRL